MMQTRVICLGLRALALLILGLMLAVAGVPGATAAAAPAGPHPNIILILADDLGYGDLGCYGQAQIKTPNLDQMAAEGMRFTQAYAGSTVCAPSRCALMTGLHTGHARIRGNATVALEPEDTTVATVLKQAGYRTGLIGKWGLGREATTGVPQKQGFDEFVGYLDQTHAHNYYPEQLWRFDPANEFDGQMEFPENAGGAKGIYSHDVFTTAGLNFVRINKPSPLNKFRPFFLFLSYTIPHANNEEGKRSGNGMEVPSTAPYSDESWPAPEKGKAAMISRMDSDIGKMMHALKQLKIDDNTVLFFTSDNGPHKEGGVDPKFFRSSGPLKGYKRDLYEGGIRIPMIVRWPGVVKSNQVSPEPLAFWDFLATAADIAGVPPPKTAQDSISMLPTLMGKSQTNRHDSFYWEFHERGFNQAVRTGNWKGIAKTGEPFELYDLSIDPGEKNNVAGEHTNVVAKIQKYMGSARTPSKHWPGPKTE